jgi:hypothetical protein
MLESSEVISAQCHASPRIDPRAESGPLRPDLHPLRDLLLKAGGDRLQLAWFVNAQVEPEFAGALLALGALFPRRSKLTRGQENACHENADAYVDAHPLARKVTGFALSDERCWRVHSRVQTPEGIVETTERRTLYFGMSMPREVA